MINYLEWNLETLDIEESVDLYDPMGSIKIVGDEEFIEEEYTVSDTSFEAFVDGIERMEVEDIVKVDPLIEPDDIIFCCKNNILKLEYGDQKTTILNKAQFVAEIRDAIINLVKILDKFAENSKQQKLELIIVKKVLSQMKLN